MFKTAEDFGGYWLKAIKDFKGHEGEPLFQANVYLNNRKIGFFSEDGWGGPAQLQDFSKGDEEALTTYAMELAGDKAWAESYHTFLAGIAEAIDRRKYYMKKCRSHCLYRLKIDVETEFRTLTAKWKGNEDHIREYLDKTYGVGTYIVIDEELKK